MADPISLMAVAGLVYAGRTLSSKSVPPPQTGVPEPQVVKEPIEVENNNFEIPLGVPQKREMGSFADITLQQKWWSGGSQYAQSSV